MTDTRLYSRLRLGVSQLIGQPVTNVVCAAPDLAVLVGRAMISPEVDPKTKAYLILAGLYTGSGLDVLPEAILGPIGLVDDGIVILEAVHRLLNETDPDVVDKLWPGDVSVLRLLQRWVGDSRDGVRQYVVRPIARWIRRTVGQAVAGSGGVP